jgi:hypothetical protein
MTESGRAFRRHAQAVVGSELHRARRRLDELPAAQRTAVEDVTTRVATAVVDCLLEQARQEPLLAASLLSIYDRDVRVDAAAVPRAAD